MSRVFSPLFLCRDGHTPTCAKGAIGNFDSRRRLFAFEFRLFNQGQDIGDSLLVKTHPGYLVRAFMQFYIAIRFYQGSRTAEGYPDPSG